jgi:molecular chaperone Hsp33
MGGMASDIVDFSGPPRATDMVSGWDFAPLAARARSVRLTASYRAALEGHAYAGPAARLLGEAAVAAVLLMGALRFDGRLSLQLQSEGPLRLLLVQCDERFAFRALVRHDRSVSPLPLDAGARLAITLEPAGRGQRYQGVVEAVPASLAATLENYFRQSEQLPTRVRLAADGTNAAGILLQAVPDRPDEGGWKRLAARLETVTDADLLGLDPVALARRRFPHETVRVYERGPAFFRCGCSEERVVRLVRALGKAEVSDIVAEEGGVDVRCEFCGRHYRFDPDSALAAVSESRR